MVGNLFHVRERSEAISIWFHFLAWGVVSAGTDRTICMKYSPIRVAADLIPSFLSVYGYLRGICCVKFGFSLGD